LNTFSPSDNYAKSARAILTSGRELMWKHGIVKVSVKDICNAAKVSKMTFYRNFENKYEVAKIILAEYAKNSYKEFEKIFAQNASFPEILRQFLLKKREQAKEVSFEFIKDLYLSHEVIASLKVILESSQNKMLGILVQSLKKAKEDGWIREEISIPFILYMFDKIGNMAEDDHLISLFETTEDMTVVLINFLFKGFLSDKKET
jgi:AcrR family transcriptional regulator